jgi:hypothetical protein
MAYKVVVLFEALPRWARRVLILPVIPLLLLMWIVWYGKLKWRQRHWHGPFVLGDEPGDLLSHPPEGPPAVPGADSSGGSDLRTVPSSEGLSGTRAVRGLGDLGGDHPGAAGGAPARAETRPETWTAT